MLRTLCTAFALVALWAAAPGNAWARIDVEAVAGEPFGVAMLTIPVSNIRGPVDLDRISIVERRGNALYPAVVRGAAGKIASQILGAAGINFGDGQIGNVFVSFLFKGDEPLEVTLRLPEEVRITITPAPPRRGRGDLVERWWRDYQNHLQRMNADGDFPPLVQTYLSSMLARRMNLPAPLLAQIGGQDSAATTETGRSLELLMGLERMHFGMLRDSMLGKAEYTAVADAPLPAVWEQLPLELAKELADVPVEPMALHVPPECFYLRFGNFTNSLWMDRLTDEYGDLANMVTLRAYQKAIDDRTQKQTAMERDPLGDLFGHTIIADVALIGMDTFEEEGGAIGYILEAKNNFILGNNMRKMQDKRLKEEAANGATLETVKIGGRDVAFASTPDNRLRSFYVQDGDYHLMTNSRAIVERFLQMGDGKGSLGASAEFRHARQLMPLTREDTIFVYFSTTFFQNLMNPHYQVELRRRMQAVVDIELVQLAQLAARREGKPHESIDDLIAAELLPEGFGKRPDGSGPIVTGKEVIDSLRGPRGFFLPIPDVKIEKITAQEERRVTNHLAALARDWKRMDPLMVGAKRTALNDKGLERVVIDANINPLDEGKYGWVLSLLGPPTDTMIQPSPTDAITVQGWFKGGMLLPRIGPHHLILGIKDDVPLGAGAAGDGLLSILQTLQETPGYLGAWPKPGYLDFLPWNLGGTATDPAGFSQLALGGLWRWQGGGFSLLSFDRGVLEASIPHLRPVKAEVPAQIRVHVSNLSELKIAGWVDEMSYDRALAASQGNVRLMRLLQEQLGVPLPEAKATAEALLDGKLICPLGGEYGLSDDRGGRWVSTAWPVPGARRPEFHSPIHKWFRGADFYLSRSETGLFAHGELDMYRPPIGLPKVDLPLFDLFGGGQKAIKPAEDVKAPAPNNPPPPGPGNRVDPPAPGAKPESGGDKSILKKPAAKTDELPPPAPLPPIPKKGKREF